MADLSLVLSNLCDHVSWITLEDFSSLFCLFVCISLHAHIEGNGHFKCRVGFRKKLSFFYFLFSFFTASIVISIFVFYFSFCVCIYFLFLFSYILFCLFFCIYMLFYFLLLFFVSGFMFRFGLCFGEPIRRFALYSYKSLWCVD